MIAKKPFQTRDGSFSLACEGLNETYHSRHGALQESEYIYRDKGIRFWHEHHPMASQCAIFEMGFGTGLNALLAAQYAKQYSLSIHYEAVEKDPLSSALLEQLQISNHFKDLGDTKTLLKVLTEDWNKNKAFFTDFWLHKKQTDYFQWMPEKGIDVIFYDAFGAHAQGEMWEADALARALSGLNKGGVWVSYCAKGSVRRALEDAGLKVNRLSGPPGKREMLQAIKLE